MKKWVSVVGIVLTVMFLGSVGVARAQTYVTTPEQVSDPVICPDGCTANTTIFTDAEGQINVGTVYTETTGTGTTNVLPVPGGYSAGTLASYAAAIPNVSNVFQGGSTGVVVTTGTLGTPYAAGNTTQYHGYYQAPSGTFYPIMVVAKSLDKTKKTCWRRVYCLLTIGASF